MVNCLFETEIYLTPLSCYTTKYIRSTQPCNIDPLDPLLLDLRSSAHMGEHLGFASLNLLYILDDIMCVPVTT